MEKTIKPGYKITITDAEDAVMDVIEIGGYNLEKSIACASLCGDILSALPAEAFDTSERVYDEMVKLYPELDETHSSPGNPDNNPSKSEVKVSKDDKVAILESPEGRKAVIIKWDNEDVTVLASKPGEKPHIHTAKSSPEMFYIAQHFYDEQGLKIKSILEAGEEIGKR